MIILPQVWQLGGEYMSYFISSLIKGMNQMEELTSWIDTKPFENLGVEMIAFTHDEHYWLRIRKILESITCPVSFHGPYIGVEATSKKGTREYEWLLESYERVFALAKEYCVKHVVFHYTQLGFDNPIELEQARQNSSENIDTLLKLAKQYQVNMLIENIAFPKDKLPLYNNEEYSDIFTTRSEALSIIDIGHGHINKMDMEAFLREHSDRVKAYHFHNNNGILDQHNSIMDGTFDYIKFSSLYKKYTPDADIVLEYEPHTKLSQLQLIMELRFLEEHMR